MTSSVREIMPFKILPFPHLIVQMVKARLLIEKKNNYQVLYYFSGSVLHLPSLVLSTHIFKLKSVGVDTLI